MLAAAMGALAMAAGDEPCRLQGLWNFAPVARRWLPQPHTYNITHDVASGFSAPRAKPSRRAHQSRVFAISRPALF